MPCKWMVLKISSRFQKVACMANEAHENPYKGLCRDKFLFFCKLGVPLVTPEIGGD